MTQIVYTKKYFHSVIGTSGVQHPVTTSDSQPAAYVPDPAALGTKSI